VYPRTINATFDAVRPRRRRVRDSAGKEWVERDAELIFQAGEYHFPPEAGGPFSVTPEDIRNFCADWAGRERICDLEDTHSPSIFNGKLGHFASVRPSDDYTRFGGTVRLEPWFEQLFADEPIKLSANWKRDPNNPRRPLLLNKVAVVPNPRISDAAMMSALFNATGRAGYPRHPNAAFERHAMKTRQLTEPDIRKLAQYLHDLTAAHGARCDGSHHGQLPSSERAGHLDDYGAHGNDRGLLMHTASALGMGAGLSASFGLNPASASFVQQCHDLALGSGAACAPYRLAMEGKLGRTASYEPGRWYAQAIDMIPAFRDYQPGRYLSSAPMSDLDYPYEAESVTMDEGGGELNQFGMFAYSAGAVAGWAAEARAEALAYADRRNAELAQNPLSGLDTVSDLPPQR
jgi:hypothetical protein